MGENSERLNLAAMKLNTVTRIGWMSGFVRPNKAYSWFKIKCVEIFSAPA